MLNGFRALAITVAAILGTNAVALSVTDLLSTTPECDSRETTDLVKQIALRELRPVLSDIVTFLVAAPTTTEEAVNLVKLFVLRVKTTDQTGDIYSCEGRLRIGAKGAEQILNFDIEYTVEPAEDDSEFQFYVIVYGLEEIIHAVEIDRAAGNL